MFAHQKQLIEMKMISRKPSIAAGKLPHLLLEGPHGAVSQAEWAALTWLFLSHSTSLPHHFRAQSGLEEIFLHPSTSPRFHLAVWESGPKQLPASSTQEHAFLPAAPSSVLLRRSTTLNQGDSQALYGHRGTSSSSSQSATASGDIFTSRNRDCGVMLGH